MKFFAFIMAVLVLALSCLPCADTDAVIKEGKAKIELTKSPTQQEDHEDACSPFCQCTCCAGFSINHVIQQVVVLSPEHTSHTTSPYTGSVIEVSLPIWQPPQLV